MDFETPNKPKSPETEKYSGAVEPELPKPPEAELKIECPERQEVVDRAIFELKNAFQALGIENWKLPEIKVRFVESEGEAMLGRVEVHDGSVEITYDQRFSSPESEATLVEELRQSDKDYPGMQQTLKHELAHVAMWSVTGLQRQPATRLVDEGWASLLENTGESLPTEQSKLAVRQGLSEESDVFNRCLDFSKPVTNEENLNAAEYKTGQALLLWIQEKFGKAKMIELIQKSPEKSRRNDDSEIPDTGGIDPDLHTLNDEYSAIVANIDNAPFEEVVKKATVWEGKQFEVALLEVTGFQNIEEVRQEFLKWVNQ